jgi:hypothetical protein
MKKVTIFFSGVLLAVTVIAAPSDQFAEERYHMKYGRYTQAEEARRKAVAAEKEAAVVYAGQACCRNMPHNAALAVKPSENETWFRAKFGRNTPEYEREKKAFDVLIAAHVARCAELGRCPLTHMSKAEASPATTARNLTEREAWLQMKYGWTFRAAERGKAMPAAEEELPVLAVAEHSPCTEACCTQDE